MLMTSSRIDTEDPGAVPGASTIYGGEIGSTGVIKTRSRQKANVLDANDNALIETRLAA